MKPLKRFDRYGVVSVAAALVLAIFLGCQHQKPVQKKENAFFDKWRVTAEKSKGYSPSPTQRSVDLEQTDEALKPEKTEPPGAGLPLRAVAQSSIGMNRASDGTPGPASARSPR